MIVAMWQAWHAGIPREADQGWFTGPFAPRLWGRFMRNARSDRTDGRRVSYQNPRIVAVQL
eukprot:5938954-Pyramimonas_sp.AAC.1